MQIPHGHATVVGDERQQDESPAGQPLGRPWRLDDPSVRRPASIAFTKTPSRDEECEGWRLYEASALPQGGGFSLPYLPTLSAKMVARGGATPDWTLAAGCEGTHGP